VISGSLQDMVGGGSIGVKYEQRSSTNKGDDVMIVFVFLDEFFLEMFRNLELNLELCLFAMSQTLNRIVLILLLKTYSNLDYFDHLEYRLLEYKHEGILELPEEFHFRFDTDFPARFDSLSILEIDDQLGRVLVELFGNFFLQFESVDLVLRTEFSFQHDLHNKVQNLLK
jgi:hypothetical protein